MPKTPLIILILVSFIVTSVGPMPVYASEPRLPNLVGSEGQVTPELPMPGAMVHLSTPVTPPLLKGIKVHPDNPFRFDFILDTGSRSVDDAHKLKEESNRLIKYFLASLTIPEADLWVNLSPYEKNRIVPESFGQTEMGRDLLAQDYMLKQITASLMYPEEEIGRKFWKRIYEESAKRYGTTNIPVNTFNKVWIVPEKAVVYENAKAGTAYVVESRLKVMLEEDYVASKKVSDTFLKGRVDKKVSDTFLHSQIIREVVIPELTKEINEGANFAQLRQVYSSLILANWYKKKIKESILAQVYADKNKVVGLGYMGSGSEQIYHRYLQSFKNGVYNFIKEEQDLITKQPVPRKYFSGGVNFFGGIEIENTSDRAMLSWFKGLKRLGANLVRLTVGIETSESLDSFSWDIPSFHGVNLLDFLRAQKKLKRQSSPRQTFEALARQGYTEDVVQSLKSGTQEEIRLDSVIGLQSDNPKGQAIVEAVSNSIDALGGFIGQFGKGVKQILAWLEDEGDQLDVLTKQANSQGWRLTIKKDQAGNFQIQLYAITDQEFVQAAAMEGISHGTIVRINKHKKIPQEQEVNSLTWLKNNLHTRFGIIENITITTRLNGNMEKVNGWKDRVFIVPNGHVPEKKENQRINIDLNAHTIKIVDNGIGMDISELSGMFIPGEGGTKATEVLSEEQTHQELNKVKVIHIKPKIQGNHVSFVRNSEVIMRISLPKDIHPASLIQGDLALEFARLIHVPQARNKVIFPSDHDPKNPWGMQLAVEKMVESILNGPLETKVKIKYINTMTAGLEALIADNQENAYVVNDIKRAIKKTIKGLIESLESQGRYVLLPNDRSFGQLRMPHGKEVIFVNEDIFEWGAQRSLQGMGATLVRYSDFHLMTQQGTSSKTLELIVADFTDQSLKPFANFNPKTFDFRSHHQLPRIKTNGYVIVPRQVAQRFLDLLEQRRKAQLSLDEKTELRSLAERIKLLAEDEPATSYEMITPEATAKIADEIKPEVTTYDDGKPDNEAIANFLTIPPQIIVSQNQKVHGPADARMKYMLRKEKVYEIVTGKEIPFADPLLHIDSIKVLANDYLWVEYKTTWGVFKAALFKREGDQIIWAKSLLRAAASLRTNDPDVEPILSPDNRHVIYKINNRNYQIFDVQKEKDIELFSEDDQKEMKLENIYIRNMRLSSNGRFVVFEFASIDERLKYQIIYDMQKNQWARSLNSLIKGEIKDQLIFSQPMIIHPYASIAEIRFSERNYYIDLETGLEITMAKACYIASSGNAYFMDGDKVRVYSIHNKQWELEDLTRISIEGVVIDKTSSIFLGNGMTFDLTQVPFGKIYRHPRFPLIIDERDPNNKKAIFVSSGEELVFRGEIVDFHPLPQSRLFTFKGGVIQVYTRSGLTTQATGAYDPNGESYVRKVRDRKKGSISTYFLSSKIQHNVLNILESEYPKVEFDGKYYVFYNPENGRAVYIDPNDLEHIQGPSKEESFTEQVPPEKLTSPWLIVRNAAGEQGFIDLRSLDREVKLGIALGLQELSPGVLVTGGFIMTPDNNIPIPTWDSVREIKGFLALLEGPRGQSILNIQTQRWIEGFRDLQGRIYLSDTGQSLVYESMTKTVNIYRQWREDHFESVDEISSPEAGIKKYFLPGTEVFVQEVELSKGNFQYKIYDFVTRKKIEASIISVDQSGRFLLHGQSQSLRIYDLKNHKDLTKISFGSDSWISHYKGRNFIAVPGFTNFFWEIDEEGNPEPYPLHGDLPAYWEKFDSQGRITIARLANGQFEEVHLEWPITADAKLVLKNNTLIINSKSVELIWLDSNKSETFIPIWDTSWDMFENQDVAYSFHKNGKIESMFFLDEKLYAQTRGVGPLERWITNDKQYILTQLPSSFVLHSNQSPWLEVKGVPEGFKLGGVNGNLFVFYNPATNEVRFFDPQKYMHGDSPVVKTVGISPEQKEKIAKLWKQVTDKRDEIIAKARSAYEPLLILIPNTDKDRLMKRFVGWYDSQEFQLIKRCNEALRGNKDQVDLDHLIVDVFVQRMSVLVESLRIFKSRNSPFFPESEETLIAPDVQNIYYSVLQQLIFDLAENEQITLDIDIPSLILPMTYGLRIKSNQVLKFVKPINQLLEQLFQMYGRTLDMRICTRMIMFIWGVFEHNPEKLDIVFDQLNKLMQKPYLAMWYEAFKKGPKDKIIQAASKRESVTDLGEAQPFVDFLMNRVDMVPTREMTLPKDIQWLMADDHGVPIENIAQLNADKPAGADGKQGMYRIEELFTSDNISRMKAIANPTLRREISQYVNVQGEAGRYAAENSQNSIDAGADKLVVRYYKDFQTGDFVEDDVDNGLGPPEGKELALVIPKSNKNEQQQLGQFIGFFGTGKFTKYAGADRVQLISNNGQNGYFFEVRVDRREGRLFLVKVGTFNPKDFPRGVTDRRIKKIEDTIPELDQMLGEKIWKIMAGMSVNEQFKLSFETVNAEGNIEEKAVSVKGKTLLTEIDFKVGNTNYGPMRLWSTQDSDMPLQVIDKKGLRVEGLTLKKEFLALIPENLQQYVQQLRLIIQIPLPLIQNRSSFEQEAVVLPVIQRYVAIEFYKALVYQQLTDPSFHINQIPRDWETSADDTYWNSLDRKRRKGLFLDKNRHLFDLVEAINTGVLVSLEELETIKDWFEGKGEEQSDLKRSREESLVSFLVQLKVQTTEGINSLLMRRIKTQAAVSEAAVKARMMDLGVSEEDFKIAKGTVDPLATVRQGSAKQIAYAKTVDAESLVIPMKKLSELQQRLLNLIISIVQPLGFNEVVLVKDEAPFLGRFSRRLGYSKVYINSTLEHSMDSPSKSNIHEPTNIGVHELGHLFEYFEDQGFKGDFEFGKRIEHDTFTHDRRFTEFMQYIAVITLLSKQSDRVQKEANKQDVQLDRKADEAMNSNVKPGGIDLTLANMNLQTQNSNGEITFNLDPAMLQHLQNSPGFTPVIIKVQPLTDLPQFLGFSQEKEASRLQNVTG